MKNWNMLVLIFLLLPALTGPAGAGETLYNGIVLPDEWPPEYGVDQHTPMPVPYLEPANIPNPILIDVGRQLFVDDFLIETTDMTQTYHQATYYSGNPVITSTTAEEVDFEGNKMAGPFSGGSWYDPCDSLFKMWYRGALGGLNIYSQLYATSTDGKNWDRPNLDVNPVVLLDHFTCTPSNPSANDQVTIDAYDEYNQQVDLGDYDVIEFCWEGSICLNTGGGGITIDVNGGAVFTVTQAMLNALPYIDFDAYKETAPPESEHFKLPFPFDTIDRAGNSVYPFSEADAFHRDSTSFLLDHNAAASERFKWFATEFPNGGAYLRYRKSSDGIHWSAPQSSKSIWGDRTTVFYNPFRDVWVCSQRTEDSSGRRNRCYTEGTSAANLMSKIQYNEVDDATGESVHWVGADPLDPRHTDPLWDHIEPQLYTLDAAPYESIMLGQFSIWQGPYNVDCGEYWVPKRNDILLGFSRDGFHWDRPDRTRFISCTWDEQSWRMGNVQSVVGTPLVVGDELYFYFNARPKPAPNAEDWDKDFQAGLAILRRDGFASMDASGSTKTLTTRPVQFTGKYLYVNVDCPTGNLKVEVLGEDGYAIEPFTLANCDPISSDATLAQVSWRAIDDLSALIGQPTRFRFSLTDGSLYAFWVSPDKSGASHGYVGGGGPGFTGPTDTVGQGEPESDVTAAFIANPASGSRPLTVAFTDESAGPVTSWSWDFGDGTTSTDQNPSHTYYLAGDHTVTLSVASPNGFDTETGVVHADEEVSVETDRYKAIVDDIKVTYSRGGCLAWHNELDDTLRIEVLEDGGTLNLTAGEEAATYWDSRCDVYIYAPDASIKKINLKGRPETQLYVCGQVGYVKNFKLKYGHVGDTLSYGPEVGLGSAAPDPPKKILIKAGWSTAAVLGIGYPGLRADPAEAQDALGNVELPTMELKSKPFEVVFDDDIDEADEDLDELSDDEGADLAGALPVEMKAGYKFEWYDIKVRYSKPGCLAYRNDSDGTLTIEIWDSDGNLKVTCGKEAYIDWGDYCDIYIDAPDASLKTINLKGRPETQLHVCGEVGYVKNFKLKYGCVGDTDYYGEDYGLGNASLALPSKIKILWGWATAPVLGISY